MAIVRICDKCGVKSPLSPDPLQAKITMEQRDPPIYDSYDLCSACSIELRQWLGR